MVPVRVTFQRFDGRRTILANKQDGSQILMPISQAVEDMLFKIALDTVLMEKKMKPFDIEIGTHRRNGISQFYVKRLDA